MASLSISIFDSFLSGGKVGSNFLSSVNATLNASTRIRSRVAWAVRYFCVALRRRRLSSRDNPTKSDGFSAFSLVMLDDVCELDDVTARRRGVFEWTIGIFSHGNPKNVSRDIAMLLSYGAPWSMS